MADSLGPDNADLRETMRDVAAQWRRLAPMPKPAATTLST
jgi:hypothetical protein